MASFKKLENGKWQVSFYCKNYLGENKKYKKGGFDTKKDAKEYADNFININKNTNNISLAILCEEFLKHKIKNGIKENTISLYNTINIKVKKFFQNLTVNEITNKMYTDFIIEECKRKKIYNVYINMVLKYGKMYYNLPEPRFLKVDIKYDTQKKEKAILTLKEFYSLQDKLTNIQGYTLASFLYWCGLRIGEALALNHEDIDLENNKITITKTLVGKNIQNSCKSTTSERIVSIPKNLREDYIKYIKETKRKNGRIFFITPVGFSKQIKKINPNISTHSFRHSHASLLLEKGIDIPTLSKRLGHSNSNITLSVYAHMLKDNDNALEILNSI